MWFSRVIWNIRTFIKLAAMAETYFREHHPEAVVLIDYPGFNWHIAKRAKKYKIPVYYYSPPQVWGWMPSRVKKMRSLIKTALSGLPFETQWLQAHGCNALYVGHPFFDQVTSHKNDTAFLAEINTSSTPLVTLLPGSRTQEVKHNFPDFLKVSRRVKEAVPQVRYAVAAFNEEHAQLIREMIHKSAFTLEEMPVYVGYTPELMQASYCTLAVSGSVSLELLYYEKPTVIAYKIIRLGWYAQWYFRRVRYITLVNLLAVEQPYGLYNSDYDPDGPQAQEPVFPEYLSCTDKSYYMARDIIHWLCHPEHYASTKLRLHKLKQQVAQPGAAQRAAEVILGDVLNNADKNQVSLETGFSE